MDKQNVQRLVGLVCFTVGLVLGVVLIAAPVWADLEASFYGFERFYAEAEPDVHCPVLMERGETGSMWVTLNNPTDREISQVVIVRLSSRAAMLEAKQSLKLAAGATQRLAWAISESNVDLGNFIFAHVIAYPAYTIPMREAMCGVFVLDAPGLSGEQLYYGLLALSVVGLGFGLWLWDTSRVPEISRLPQVRMAMRFLVFVLLVGVAASAMGVWLIGVLALVVLLLTMSTILYLVTSG